VRLLGKAGWALFGLYLLATYGCASLPSTPLPPGPAAGEEQAVHIAWVEVYGRKDRPPLVRWVQGAQLVCTDPNSGKGGFWIPDPDEGVVCREGLTMSYLECFVAWHGEASFAETALAHELLHVAQARGGVFDPRHKRPEWQPGGLLERANAAIREAGR
jgi:hypothetical protein